MYSDALFKCLADSTRLRCLLLLLHTEELCVCDLTQVLELPQPKISRHLATLRQAELVLDMRQGTWIYYRIHPELPDWVQRMLDAINDGLANHHMFQADRQRMHTTILLTDCN